MKNYKHTLSFYFLIISILFGFTACENPTTSSTTDEATSPTAEAEAEVEPGTPAIVCVDPPTNLPSLWSQYIYPNCFFVTVQSPAANNNPEDQVIALVFDASANMDEDTWYPVSFNSYSPDDRDLTQFAISYYPDTNMANHPGVLSVRDFRYVKEELDY